MSYRAQLEIAADRLSDERLRPWAPRPRWLLAEVDALATRAGTPRDRVFTELLGAARALEREKLRSLRYVVPLKLFHARVLSYKLWKARRDRARYRITEPAATPAPSQIPSARGKRASIVVLSYNRPAYLETTIASVHATTHPDDFELIVVDNGSSSETARLLRDMSSRGLIHKLILRSKNHGISRGFNSGFAYADASTDFVVKLDSDIKLLTPGWLPRFCAVFEANPDIAILANNQVNIPLLWAVPPDRRGDELLVSWRHWTIGGACMTIPRAVFDRLGYFNEDFSIAYSADDTDYHARVQLAGYDAFYVRDCISYHRMDLDGTTHRKTEAEKHQAKQKSEEERTRLFMAYLAGTRDINVRYPAYDACVFPRDAKIIEVESSAGSTS